MAATAPPTTSPITPTGADSYLNGEAFIIWSDYGNPGRSRLREPADDGADHKLIPSLERFVSRERRLPALREVGMSRVTIVRLGMIGLGGGRLRGRGRQKADARLRRSRRRGAMTGARRNARTRRRSRRDAAHGADLRADGDGGRHDVRDRGPLHRRGRDAAGGRAVRRGDGARSRRLHPRLRLPGRRLPGERLHRSASSADRRAASSTSPAIRRGSSRTSTRSSR